MATPKSGNNIKTVHASPGRNCGQESCNQHDNGTRTILLRLFNSRTRESYYTLPRRVSDNWVWELFLLHRLLMALVKCVMFLYIKISWGCTNTGRSWEFSNSWLTVMLVITQLGSLFWETPKHSCISSTMAHAKLRAANLFINLIPYLISKGSMPNWIRSFNCMIVHWRYCITILYYRLGV